MTDTPASGSIEQHQQRLLNAVRQLDARDCATVTALAEHLARSAAQRNAEAAESAARSENVPVNPPSVEENSTHPPTKPQPQGESVIAALRRLAASAQGLDDAALLHQSAALMSEHLLQGRPAAAVITDLERLFHHGGADAHTQSRHSHCVTPPGAQHEPTDR